MLLRTLAILSVFLVVTNAGFPAPRKAADPKADSGHRETQNAQTEQPSASDTSTIPQPTYSTTFNTYPDKKEDKDGWDKASVFANILLAIIGIGGVVVALKTLLKLERQTKATEDAAKAALHSLSAAVSAERPWISVVIRNNDAGIFEVYAKNRGKSPAIITASYIGCAAVKSLSQLSSEAKYFPGSLVKELILFPRGAVVTNLFGEYNLKKWLKQDFPNFIGENQIFVFGKVVYRNLANPDKAFTHETRWIALYEFPIGDEGNSFFMVKGIGVSDEYERFT